MWAQDLPIGYLVCQNDLMKTSNLHENLDREDEVVGPSNRNFGLTLGAVFGLVAALKVFYWSPWSYLWAGLGAAMLALALFCPKALTLPNKAWLRLGLVLHTIVNPVVMAILFYFTFLPIGLLLRLFDKDVLRLKWEREAKSYWIPRTDTRPLDESMRQQF
jgi:saxitoxin biosynthesis operon SxtJ-like protein